MREFDWGSRGGERRVHDRVLTVPNGITVARLAGLPVFVWLVVSVGALGWAFALLVVIAATDWVDGYVARRFDQVSRIGALIDPLVDRVLMATVGLTLLAVGILPAVPVVALILRDVLVLGGALLLFGGIPPIAVTRVGKAATAMLLVALPAFLFAAVLDSDVVRTGAWVLTGIGLCAYYGAGVQYARAAIVLRRGSHA